MRCLYSSDNSTISIDEENDFIIINQINIFTKLAISYALAQSVKLSSWEISVERLLENTQPIHEELARKGAISLSKKKISIKIWILFQENYSIDVHSEVLDIPEVFWKCLTTSQYIR